MPSAVLLPPPSYRPHDAGHNYYAPGIYLITLVTRGRTALFGRLNDDLRQPAVQLTPTGQAVMDCWHSIPAHNAQRGRHVRLHGAICMPDHFHGVIEVVEAMDVPLGQLIRGFKSVCTQAWWAYLDAQTDAPITGAGLTNMPHSGAQQQTPCPDHQPSMAADQNPNASCVAPNSAPCADKTPTRAPCADIAPNSTSWPATCQPPAGTPERPCLVDRQSLRNMSKKQRAQYYATHPEARQPLFDDNYDDTICLTDPATGSYDPRHFRAMINYVADNPRRAIVRRLRPQFMEHRQHIRIAGRDYAAFGNLFLLRWAKKVQVFCHRRTPDGRNRYVDSEAFRDDCRRWKAQVMAGATVLVTPGISAGELLIKNRCIEQGYPLIHIQKEPLPPFKKPEITRFEACARGTLLILSPWQPEALGDYLGVPSHTEYSIFHNLNDLAREICEGEGALCWVNDTDDKG